MRTLVACALVALLVGAGAAQATIYDLYGGTTTSVALAGTGGNGYQRAQEFKPSTALYPMASGTFQTVSMFVQLVAGETASVQLKVYAWNTNPATTETGAVLGQTAVIPIVPGAGTQEIKAVLTAPQAATGTYFASLYLSGISGPTGMNLNGIGTNTGGTSNDAWNLGSGGWGSARTDREYAITVNTVPEPAVALLLIGAAPMLLRRRRA